MLLRDSFTIEGDNCEPVEVIRIRTIEYKNKQFAILGITKDAAIGCQVCNSFGYSCFGSGLLVREINGKFLLPVEDEIKEGIMNHYLIKKSKVREII